MKQRLVVWTAIAAAVVITSWVLAADFTGTWLGTTEVRDRGTDRLTLVLKKGPSGYSGTATDSLELIAKDTAITDVKLDGGVLTFSVPTADGVHSVTIRMQFKGDKATGEWATAEGDLGTLVFEKQKK